MRFEEVVPAAEAQHRDGGVYYRRANKRNWFIAAFILVWLCGWSFGGTMAFRAFTGGAPGEAQGFLGFWLVAWAFGWVAAATSVLWMLIGGEAVTASPIALTHTMFIGPAKWERHYKAGELRNLRWRDGASNPAFMSGRGTKPSAVVVDYGAKSLEILRGIGEAEATTLFDKLRPALGMQRAEA
jgi:hypothetical protein